MGRDMLSRCTVCLVGTSNPENLGSVARLLDNFAAGGMALVAPRVPPDDHRALVVGRAARQRLADAPVVATVEEAVRDCVYVVGFSARRGADRPMVGLRQLGALLDERAPAGRVALVFGPEDTGLQLEHIERCDAIAAIETPGPLASFNLAQAVGIALWELSRPTDGAAPSVTPPATRAEIEPLLDHAFAALDAIGYLRDEERERKRTHLRRLVSAARLGSDELRGLHGICAQLLRVVPPTKAGPG
jgi:tRNA (cytidine32/uridine32-2'-O)-methyltransferase